MPLRDGLPHIRAEHDESSTKIVRKKSGLVFSGANIIILTGVMKLLKDVPDVLYYINSATFIHL